MGFLKSIGKALGGVVGGPVGAAIGGAIGGAISGKKAKKASKAEQAAYAAAQLEQRNALAAVQAQQQPYSDLGRSAIGGINALNSGDYSGFENSPDYLFAQQQGGQAVDRSAAARGGLNSGNTLVAQQRFGQGLASQQLGAYRNSLFDTVGIGQRAADTNSSAITSTASNIGNLLVGGGDARASGIVANGNAITGAIDQVFGAAGDYAGNTLVKKPKRPRMTLNYSPPTASRAV